MVTNKVFIVIFTILISLVAYAAEPTALFMEKFSNFVTFSAEFEQQVVADAGQVLQQSSGHIYITRPGNFAWYVEHPMPQVIITKGTTLSVYDESLSQVTYSRIDASSDLSYPALLLSSTNNDLLNKFTITELGSESYQLSPVDQNALFTNVVMQFSADKLQQIQIHDALSQTIQITFSDVTLNQEISPDKYQLELPEGVDQIDLG